MRKCNLLLIVFALYSLNLFAQGNYIGINANAGLVNVNGVNNSSSKFLFVLNPSLSFQSISQNNFLFAIDLMYETKGNSYTQLKTDPNGATLNGTYTVKFRYNYIALPIKVGYHSGGKLFGIVAGGLNPSFFLNEYFYTPTFDANNNQNGSKTIQITSNNSREKMNVFDLAPFAEFGGGIKFNQKISLQSVFKFQYSLTSFNQFNPHHYGISLSVGLKYCLSKKEALPTNK